MWEIPVDKVEWEDGQAKAVGVQHSNLQPLTLGDRSQVATTGGPIAGHNEWWPTVPGCRSPATSATWRSIRKPVATRVLRYAVIQDAGKAIHPDYVEGQFQGAAAQGIGWALNEEYVYGKDGRLQNPGFLDYRIPVCSDLPFIDTQILEIPNPGHPYGIRGVGETSIVPPLAAIGNAVSNAVGVRMTHVPMSPPRILKAIKAQRAAELVSAG
jgi:CO/xanthine dehydrogenase Mo-binding subunit